MLDQRFRGMRDALQGMQPGASSPEQQAANQRLKDMLADLNQLLDKHARGEDTTDDFAEFMAKHGDLFPGDPQNVDELVDELARQAAAAERLMRLADAAAARGARRADGAGARRPRPRRRRWPR